MSETINNEEANKNALENLPDSERKETEEILSELEGEQAKPEGDKPKDPEKPDKPKPEGEGDEGKPDKEKADETDEEGKPKTDDISKSKERRSPKLMPSWKHEVALKDKDKEIDILKAQIEEISKGAKPEGDQAKPEETNSVKDQIAEAIKKANVDVAPEFLEDIIRIAQAGAGKVPEELTQKLRDLDELKSQAEITAEENAFSKDFAEVVVPLIEAEYGKDLPEDAKERAAKIEEIKESLKAIAYTDEYAKVPYDVIYRGNSEFRDLVKPRKRSAEDTRSDAPQVGDGEKDYGSMTEEEVKNLSPEEFEKWSNHMAAQERNRG